MDVRMRMRMDQMKQRAADEGSRGWNLEIGVLGRHGQAMVVMLLW